jgi:putative peptide maturation dehydrogenase
VSQKVRRTRWAFLRCSDGAYLDVGSLLRGDARLELEPQLRSVSILTGVEHDLEPEELELLLTLPSDRAVESDDERIEALVEKGLVVVEGSESEERERLVSESNWNLYAALYHSFSRWRGVDVDLDVADEVDERLIADVTQQFVDRHGPPPEHFHEAPGAVAVRALPLVDDDDGVFRALARRKTSRHFDRSQRLGHDQLALLLRSVFGVQGTAVISGEIQGVRKTSPSGGGLHPIEAYPLVLDADGIEPGLYHYRSGSHELALLEPIARAEAEELAERFTAGQAYFRDASVLVVMTARFGRSFWKYRGHGKAYAVTLMDAGHLSQTFYLACAELGLGAFVTAAINNADIDDRLGLDGFAQGSLAIVGCGGLVEESSYLQPEFTAHRPAR